MSDFDAHGSGAHRLLERRLGALAELIDVDVQHRLVDDVLASLDAPVGRPMFTAPRRRVVLVAGLLAAVVVAAVLVFPGPRRTVANWFGIGSTRIDVRPVSTSTAPAAPAPAGPSTSTSTASSSATSVAASTTVVTDEPTVPVTFPTSLRLGSPTTPADAADRTGLPVASAPSLGPPQGIYVVTPPTSGQVVVVYPPSDVVPASPVAGVGALLSTMPGTINDGLYVKVSGTAAESFTFTTSTGTVVHAIWLGGAPHEYVFEDRNGAPVFDTLRLATHTLLWQDGPVTYRLEADLTRDQAVRVAASVVAG